MKYQNISNPDYDIILLSLECKPDADAQDSEHATRCI